MSGLGRPSLYRPDFCALAREHCRQGGSLDRFARLVGVSARSIDNWVVRFPEFAAAVGEGRAEAEAETDRLLYHRAVGWRETVTRTVFCAGQPKDVLLVRDRKPDAAACMRWLCRNLPQQWPASAQKGSADHDVAWRFSLDFRRKREKPHPNRKQGACELWITLKRVCPSNCQTASRCYFYSLYNAQERKPQKMSSRSGR